jgi:ribosome-binding protein aMBF1 (putative translation factor)
MIDYSKGAVVDAIEDGKIVRVPEDYARREGLLILRRQESVPDSPLTPKEKKDSETRRNKGFIGMDDLRRPLKSQRSDLQNELVENFHWILIEKRKSRGVTRKKLAEAIGESEMSLKMIENGVLPMNNFILVNKLESYFGVSLRRNKVANVERGALRQVIDFARKEQKKPENRGADEVIDVSEDSGKKMKEKTADDEGFIDLTNL